MFKKVKLTNSRGKANKQKNIVLEYRLRKLGDATLQI